MRISTNYYVNRPVLRSNNNKQPVRKDVNFTGWGKNIEAPCLLVCDWLGTLDHPENYLEIVGKIFELARRRNAKIAIATSCDYCPSDLPPIDYLIYKNNPSDPCFKIRDCKTGEELVQGLASKGDGVEKLQKITGISSEETITAGDDYRDLSMSSMGYFIAPEGTDVVNDLRGLIENSPKGKILGKGKGAEGVLEGITRIIEAKEAEQPIGEFEIARAAKEARKSVARAIPAEEEQSVEPPESAKPGFWNWLRGLFGDK
ncbi:MAG: HAD hydrolase family protein [Candidatus Gastranaerophilales bacterium]|nr:HAD hydrolase family protein [Candidatus Gastranaerophilales bacterium]